MAEILIPDAKGVDRRYTLTPLPGFPGGVYVRLERQDTGAEYYVSARGDHYTCNCPDKRFRFGSLPGGICKHIESLQQLLLEGVLIPLLEDEPMNEIASPQVTLPARQANNLSNMFGIPAPPAEAPRQISIAEAMSLGDIFYRSGYFTEVKSAAQAVVKILAGAEMGFGPMASMADVHVIPPDGRPSIGAHLRAAAIKRSGKYDYRILQLDSTLCELEFHLRPSGEVLGKVKVEMADMVKTGLTIDKYGNTKVNWKRSPDDMLFARAISKGYRRFCADLTGAVLAYDPDEMDVQLEPGPEPAGANGGATSPPPPPPADTPVNEDQLKSLILLLQEGQVPFSHLIARYQVPDLEHLPALHYEDAKMWLGRQVARKRMSQIDAQIDALVLELQISPAEFQRRLIERFQKTDTTLLSPEERIFLLSGLRLTKAQTAKAPAAGPVGISDAEYDDLAELARTSRADLIAFCRKFGVTHMGQVTIDQLPAARAWLVAAGTGTKSEPLGGGRFA